MESTTSLGKYRLLAELGRGGMAKVFLAVATGPAGFNKLLVIKEIQAQLADDPEFVNMFLDEARLAARLNHPNVVQTNEVGQQGHSYFIAMEYLEGQPLNRVINKMAGQLSLSMQLRVVSEALNGLHHAHELKDFDGTPLNVVHRDISPHNVFVTYSGQVKVVDFGIAKALNSSSETRSGVLKGKIAYMSPEQAMSERVDRRADIFSVGVVLWQLVAGKRMYRALPEIAVIKKLLDHEIPPIRDEVPDIDPTLEAIIGKALAPKRENRYASAAELQADLDAFVDSLDDRRGCRDVGKLMAVAFEEDRRKVEAVVEQQLRAPAKPRLDDLPMIELGTMSVSGKTMEEMQLTPSAGFRSPDSMRTTVEPMYAPPHIIPLDGARPSSTISSVTMKEAGPAPAPSHGKRSYAMIALFALIGGAALAVGVVALQKAGAPAAPPSGQTASAETKPTAPAPATAAAPGTSPSVDADPTTSASGDAAQSAEPLAVKRRVPGKLPPPPGTGAAKPPPPPPPSDIRLNR